MLRRQFLRFVQTFSVPAKVRKRTIRVEGLDAHGQPVTEFVELRGSEPVMLSSDMVTPESVTTSGTGAFGTIEIAKS